MNSFESILFSSGIKNKKEVIEMPSYFIDLNLDQIIDDITENKKEYNLRPLFYTNLTDVESIKYRQEIMNDLENPKLFRHITTFAENMQNVRKQLLTVNNLYYQYHKERLFLDVVSMYCDALVSLENFLFSDTINSKGLLAFRNFLKNYLSSSYFVSLKIEINRILENLSTIKYCIRIKGRKIQVQNYNSEADFNFQIEEIFARFKQNEVKNYKVGLTYPLEMNHVEAQILDGVALLNPEIFTKLDFFYNDNQNFLNKTIVSFDREIQFYISYLEYISKIKSPELNFCYPKISDSSKEIYCNNFYDLALASKMSNRKSLVVVNDFNLKDNERILVISGPNQSGKTTFARTIGQLHFLASIGCPVPGKEARLFLFDHIFTHFEKKENIIDLRGKLEDDLYRIEEILSKSTSKSIIIMNEIFTSTTLKDAIFLGKKIMQKIINLDLLGVWVSFIDELSSFSEQTVSMSGSIVPENPDLRTYKIVRKPADGLAYALSIAEKYQLTYHHLKKRLNK